MGVIEVAGFVALAALLFLIERVFKWLQRRNLTGNILRSEAGDTPAPPTPTAPFDASQSHHHADVHHGGFGDHGGFGGGHGH